MGLDTFAADTADTTLTILINAPVILSEAKDLLALSEAWIEERKSRSFGRSAPSG